jgi:hypothetical protein
MSRSDVDEKNTELLDDFGDLWWDPNGIKILSSNN